MWSPSIKYGLQGEVEIAWFPIVRLLLELQSPTPTVNTSTWKYQNTNTEIRVSIRDFQCFLTFQEPITRNSNYAWVARAWNGP